MAGVRLALLQRPDALMLGVVLACGNAYLTARARRAPAATDPGGMRRSALVVWLVMLNLSSGLMKKLGGPYVEYLPDGAREFTRPQMLDTMYWFRFGHTLGALGVRLHPDRTGPVLATGGSAGSGPGARSSGSDGCATRCTSGTRCPTSSCWRCSGGADAPLSVQLIRTPILIAAAFAVSLPVYYLVELRVLRMKLGFASEKEVLDLRTGQDGHRRPRGPDRLARPDAVARRDR